MKPWRPRCGLTANAAGRGVGAAQPRGVSSSARFARLRRTPRQLICKALGGSALERDSVVEGAVRDMKLGRTILEIMPSFLLVAIAGCQQQAPDIDVASTDHTKALVRRWIEEGFNQRQLVVVDEIFAAQVVVNGHGIDRAGLKRSMSRHLDAFPDLRVTIDDILAEGPKVGIWYTVQGTHRGEFEAIPPTGNHVSWVGFDLFTIEGGRIVEARFLSDWHGLLTQLGATVSPPASQGVRP